MSVLGAATIPGERLYWLVLGSEHGRATEASRRYAFERVLPVPVESLHVVSATLDDGRTVLAGLAPDALRAHLAGSAALWSCCPAGLPPHLIAAQIPESVCSQLNLLVGPFEPARRRALRRGAVMIALGLGLLILVLLVVGVERRARHAAEQVRSLRSQVRDLLDRHLPSTPGVNLPPEARLIQELRLVEAGERRGVDALSTARVAASADAVMARWPKDLRLQVETLTLTTDRITVRGNAPSGEDAQRLLEALQDLDDGQRRWRGETPVVQRQGEAFTFVISLLPQPSGRPVGGGP